MATPHDTLFAGQWFPAVTRRDGSPPQRVRVREMPVRHHLELLELFHTGREADLLQRCCEVARDDAAGAGTTWEKVDAAWVDSLSDASHVALLAAAEELNFSRAIATAQRAIARGQQLAPVLETMAKQMLEPMRKELGSWMSSLTSQLSAAVAAKKP